jgi:hypothetical protein
LGVVKKEVSIILVPDRRAEKKFREGSMKKFNGLVRIIRDIENRANWPQSGGDLL